ncbi:hypothetical protein D3C87_1418450 [compost metagenome]
MQTQLMAVYYKKQFYCPNAHLKSIPEADLNQKVRIPPMLQSFNAVRKNVFANNGHSEYYNTNPADSTKRDNMALLEMLKPFPGNLPSKFV